jgi:type IV pilus assembly protein PilC
MTTVETAPIAPAPASDPGSESGPGLLKRLVQLEITPQRVPRKELMHFSRQLAVFIRAGIPVLEALDAIGEEMGNRRLKGIVTEIGEDLRAGSTFSDAAEKHAKVFPDYYRGMLRSAEMSGNLDSVLDQLADYIDRDIEARRKITGALVYPGVILGLAVVVVVVLAAFVLPRFEKFFKSLDAKLPLATRMLLAVTHFLTHWGWALALGLLALVIALVLGSRTDRGRALLDRTLLRIPILGDVIKHALLERFCRVLSAMVVAGVTLPDALAVTTGTLSNSVFRRGLTQAREEMMHGDGLARPLARTGLFPAAARQMFVVGETSGTLDDQLGGAASYFERELDYKVKRLTTLFEPAVLIVVGILVGFVAIALVSAMYGIFRQVKP